MSIKRILDFEKENKKEVLSRRQTIPHLFGTNEMHPYLKEEYITNV